MTTHPRFPQPIRTLVTLSPCLGILTARFRNFGQQRSAIDTKRVGFKPQGAVDRFTCLIILACLFTGATVATSQVTNYGAYRCIDINTDGSYNCEESGCRIQVVKPNQGFCATATDFVLRDLKPGEQMCCTATEAIVRTVGPGKCLLCDRAEGQLFDRLPETDFAHFPDYCCTADKCNSYEVNLYNDERVVCNAFQAVKIPGLGRKVWGVACTNNKCYKALLAPNEQLACKRFNVTP